MKRAHIVISGIVQGTGFRSYAKKYADELELKGFVRNLRGGNVELVVEGYDPQINNFFQILRKGPQGAKIEDIEIEWEEPTNEFKGFEMER